MEKDGRPGLKKERLVCPILATNGWFLATENGASHRGGACTHLLPSPDLPGRHIKVVAKFPSTSSIPSQSLVSSKLAITHALPLLTLAPFTFLPSHIPCLDHVPTTRPLEGQKRKMASHHRSRKEVRTREATIALGVVKIGKGAIGDCLVDPTRHTVEHVCAHVLGRDGGGFELPVRLGVQVAAVEGEPVFLEHRGVPVGLQLVDVVGNEVGGGRGAGGG